MHGTRTTSSLVTRWAGALACTALFASVWYASGQSVAAEDQAKPQQKPEAASKVEGAGRSLDDTLLEDLDNELLDGVGDLKKPPAGRADGPTTARDAEANPDSGAKPIEQPIDGEDVGMSGADDDPLGYISQEMRLVEELIPQRGKRAHAEQVQQRIVEDLARLIEQAEQQSAQQQPSSNNNKRQQSAQRESVKQPKSTAGSNSRQNATKPAADSTDRLGQAEQAKPDPELFRGVLKDAWGNLPEREREQMMQISPERFLPQYELLIERYYRRLAEQHSK